MEAPRSGAEVTNVSSHGFWVFLQPQNRELFLPFREFPWFADASIRELSLIEVEHGHILRWPELDVDLDVDRIDHPERYPLIARNQRSLTVQSRRTSAMAKRPRTAKPRRTAATTKRGAGKGRSSS